jgi:hypothetical protein
VYLYVRDGLIDDVVAYVQAHLRPATTVMTKGEAIAAGLFGPGVLADRAAARIGDVLLFPRANLQLVFTVRTPEGNVMSAPQFRGLHGGLTEDEALVPLLALRF